MLFNLDDDARVALHYRSSLTYRIDGNATFSNPAVPAAAAGLAAGINASVLATGRITSDVKIPAILNLAYSTKVNDRWDLMADVQWTQWSTIRKRNAWKLAVGANYRYSLQWTLRGGVALDQSPVQERYMTARLPDAERTWLTLGARYTANAKPTVDVGAAYLFVNKARINDNGDPGNPSGALANGLVNGYYDSRVVILSAQLNYAF